MKGKKDALGIIIAAAVAPILVFVGMGIWSYGYAYRFRAFRSDFAASVAYAQTNDSLIADDDGARTRVASHNADSLYREITGARMNGYQKEMPEGKPIQMVFGNGDRMRVWEREGGGLTVCYEKEGQEPVIMDVDATARYVNMERLVSTAWGNEPCAGGVVTGLE